MWRLFFYYFISSNHLITLAFSAINLNKFFCIIGTFIYVCSMLLVVRILIYLILDFHFFQNYRFVCELFSRIFEKFS